MRKQLVINNGGSTKGIFALAAGRGLTAEDFQFVPGDADLVVSTSLSLSKIIETGRKIATSTDPRAGQMVDQSIKQLETELGLTLENDILPALGDAWTIYDSPSAGGFFITSAVLSLEIKDAAKGQALYNRLIKILDDSLPGVQQQGFRRRGALLVKHEFMGQTVHMINMVGDDIPFAPSFCLTKNQLLVAPHPQAIKSHLRFLAKPGPAYSVKFAAGQKTAPEGETIFHSSLNIGPVLRAFIGTTPYWGQMLMAEIQREGIEIDTFAIPSARALLANLGEASASVVRTKTALILTTNDASPLPLSTGGMLMPMVAGFALFSVRSSEFHGLDIEAVPAKAIAEPPVIEEKAVDEAKIEVKKIEGKKPAVKVKVVPGEKKVDERKVDDDRLSRTAPPTIEPSAPPRATPVATPATAP